MNIIIVVTISTTNAITTTYAFITTKSHRIFQSEILRGKVLYSDDSMLLLAMLDRVVVVRAASQCIHRGFLVEGSLRLNVVSLLLEAELAPLLTDLRPKLTRRTLPSLPYSLLESAFFRISKNFFGSNMVGLMGEVQFLQGSLESAGIVEAYPCESWPYVERRICVYC